MKESVFGDMNESVENFTDKWKCFVFREFLALFEQMLKISFIAKLSDDVAIVSSAENIVAFENVRMIQFFKGINLPFKHAFLRFSLDGPDVYHFDGYFFFGFIIAAFIDH